MRTFRGVLVATALLAGCVATAPPPVTPATLGGVTIIPPQCAGVDSCLLGHVVAAETARPLAQAAVFLQREGQTPKSTEGVRILTLTDDQGVFTVVDAPPGKYRLAVYKDARRVEVRGLDLGARGTTMVPVRLPPG